jgi:Fe-Mn family superoxide dismutase
LKFCCLEVLTLRAYFKTMSHKKAPFIMKKIALVLACLILPAGFALTAGAVKPDAAAGPFTLPGLPYDASALSAAIDEQTMNLHHGKHHRAFVDNLNKAAASDPALGKKSVEEILASVSAYPASVRNNAGGHWNHSFFWTIMSPEKTEPSPALAKAISSTFGSMEAFKKKFEEAGMKQFGSGWVWLIVDDKGALQITTTPNQDNPLMNDAPVRGTPILGNDLWEHAYYLRYNNRRAEYLSKWWDVVNWTKVSALYDAATNPAAKN